MRNAKRKAARVMSFVLSVITVLTTISYPMETEAATPTTVKIKSASEVNDNLPASKYLLGLLGVSGTSSGVTYPGTGNAEVSAEWRVGKAYSAPENDANSGPHAGESNVYSVSIATKYLYEREIRKPKSTTKYTTGLAEAVYPETSAILGKKFVINEDLLTQGYHWFSEELPVGTQIPIRSWVPAGNAGTIHQEGYDAVAKANEQHNSTTYKLLGDGRWAMYHGFEFHAGEMYPSVRAINKGTMPASACGMRDAITIQKWNYTYWFAFCDICGEPINAQYISGYHVSDPTLNAIDDYKSIFHLYAPKDAVESLPVLEVGREFVLFCPYCGGMENTWHIEHKCKSMSPNMYLLKYDKNAPDAQGFMATSSWLTNFEEKYNGVKVTTSGTRNVSKNKFFREGYAFKGWSLTPDGPVDATINAATSLVRFQTNPATGDFYEDGHVTTLYAVWGPEENTLSVDTFTKNTVPNIHGTGVQPVWNTGYTGNGTTVYSDSNKVASWTIQYSGAEQTKDVLLNTSAIAYPSGAYVYFSPTEKGSTLTGTLSTSNGHSSDLKDDSGKKYKVGKVNVSGYTTGGALYGEVSHTTDANGVTTALHYKYGQGDGGYVDMIYVLFEQDGIVLPEITPPSEKTFIGWYTSDDAYVGKAGDYYPSPKSGDVTLYPKFSEFKVEVVDIYYKESADTTADEFNNRATTDGGLGYRGGIGETTFVPSSPLAVQHATGAINLRMSQFSAPGTTTVYKAYWAETKKDVEDDSASTKRKQFDVNGTDAMKVPEAVNKSFTYNTDKLYNNYTIYNYEIPSTGTYDVTIAGAAGCDYVDSGTVVHKGGSGDVITQRYYLNKGDVLQYAIGKVGNGSTGKNDDDTPNGLNGGDRSYVRLQSAVDGTWSSLMIAGGGGAASTSVAGGNGGETDPTHLLTTGVYGEDGQAGGGAGSGLSHGGKAGVDGGVNSGGYYRAYINSTDSSKTGKVYEMTDETFSTEKSATSSVVDGLVYKYTHGTGAVTDPAYAVQKPDPHLACSSNCITKGVLAEFGSTPTTTKSKTGGKTKLSHTADQWVLACSTGSQAENNGQVFLNTVQISGDADGWYEIPTEAQKDGRITINLGWGEEYPLDYYKDSDMTSHTTVTVVNGKGEVIYSNYIGAGDQYANFKVTATNSIYALSYKHVLADGTEFPCTGYDAYLDLTMTSTNDYAKYGKGALCDYLFPGKYGISYTTASQFVKDFKDAYGIDIGQNSGQWSRCPFCALQSKTGVHTFNVSGTEKFKVILSTNERPTCITELNSTHKVDSISNGGKRRQKQPETFWYEVGDMVLDYATGQLNFRAYYVTPDDITGHSSGVFQCYEDEGGNVKVVDGIQEIMASPVIARSHIYHTSSSTAGLRSSCFGCMDIEGKYLFAAGPSTDTSTYGTVIGFGADRSRLLWDFDTFKAEADKAGATVIVNTNNGADTEQTYKDRLNATVLVNGSTQKKYYGGYINTTQAFADKGKTIQNTFSNGSNAWVWNGLKDENDEWDQGEALYTFNEDIVIGSDQVNEEGKPTLTFTKVDIAEAKNSVLKLDFTYSGLNGEAYDGVNGVQAIGHFVVTVVDTVSGNIIYSSFLNKQNYTTEDGCTIVVYGNGSSAERYWDKPAKETRVKFKHEDGTWCGNNCQICLKADTHVIHEVDLGSTTNFRIYLTANEQSIDSNLPTSERPRHGNTGAYPNGGFDPESYFAYMPNSYTIKVNGIYQEYKIADPTYVKTTPAYGGSSYINTDASLTKNHPNVTTSHKADNSKDGYGMLKSVEIGMMDSLDNETIILGAKMPDRKAPEITRYEVDTSLNRVLWEEPENDQTDEDYGSAYWFIAERYEAKVSGSDVVLDRRQVSKPVSKLLVSAIAGYYWSQDSNPDTEIADTVPDDKNSYKINEYTYAGHFYTGPYTASGKSYSLQFTQDTSVTYSQSAVNAGDCYIHVAPVDVAGNIGPTITVSGDPDVQVPGYTEPVGIITFHTNAMQYQNSPWLYVTYENNEAFKALRKTTVTSTAGRNPSYFSGLKLWATEDGTDPKTDDTKKLNNVGYYLRGFYALDDVEKKPTGGTYNGFYKVDEATKYEKLNYGLTWPTPYNGDASYNNVVPEGTFVGWNDKANGKGTWYSQTGTGNGSGSDPNNTKKPVLREITGYDIGKGETQYENSLTLYAIWGEQGSVDADVAYEVADSSMMKSYLAGIGTIAHAKTMGAGVWTTKAAVNTHGQFDETGIQMLEQTVKSKALSNNKLVVGVYDYYTAYKYEAAGSCVPGYLIRKTLKNKSGSTFTTVPSDWNVDSIGNAEPVVIGDTTKDQSAHESNRILTSTVDFNAIYSIQGSYEVDYAAYSRQYSEDQNDLGRYGQGWGTGEANGAKAVGSTSVSVKIDKTSPYISYYRASQGRLTDYKAEEIENPLTGISAGVDGDIAGGIDLTTTFTINVSDYNDENNGAFVSKEDSSGIYGVYVMVMDADDNSISKVYEAKRLTETLKTDNEDRNTLAGIYQLKVNLYKEFPQAVNVVYCIYAVDNAGNRSEYSAPSELLRTQVQTGAPGYETGMGTFPNFTIKTVIRNDEGEEYNAGEGETYFQVGDIGHLEVWTVGYVENIDVDFGDVGKESAKEILNGTNPSKFNLGILGTYSGISFARNVSWEKAEVITPNSLTYVENGTAKKVPISNTALYVSVYDGSYYGQPMTQNYISHWTGSYNSNGWLSEGVNTRIPPYYPLVEEGSKKHPDGSPMYKWELWNYQVIGHKRRSAEVELTIPATSTYFIWDTRANDVHYRVLHES